MLDPEDIIAFRETADVPPGAVDDLCDLATIGFAVVRRNGQALGARNLSGGAWTVGAMVRLAKDAVDAYFTQRDLEEP